MCYRLGVNVVTLHVLHSEPSNDFGDLRIAAPGLDRTERVAVWEGLPPPPIAEHPSIAPVVLQGDLDGHRAYAERMPQGLRLTDIKLPRSLLPVVALAVFRALDALHAKNLIHGHLTPGRVSLGHDGSVMVIGRGRRGGSALHDLQAAADLFDELGLYTEPDVALQELEAAVTPADVQALATLVQEVGTSQLPVLEQVLMQVGPSPDDSLDEILPDIGPDRGDEVGLLDRWAVTTSARGADFTADLTDADLGAGGSGAQQLSVTLWTRLAARREHTAPMDRFAAVHGEPSRGLRALLADEPQEGLPAMMLADVGTFLLNEAPDTEVPDVQYALEFSETHSSMGDEDGDTAIYNINRVELAAALHRTDLPDAMAALEARLQQTERRLAETERHMRDRADELRRQDRTSDGQPHPLAGFLRVEVFVAATLAGLLVWLLLQAMK